MRARGKAGAAGKEHAEAQRDAEMIKVEELAARTDPVTAQAAFEAARERVIIDRKASSGTFPAASVCL